MTRANLLSHRRAGQQLRLSYRPEAAEELREIVALERTCCAVLDFDVQENDTGVVLTITAPPHAEESAEGLFSQFTPGPKQQPSMTGCGCSSERSCR